jgi:hypothetical protein
MKTLLSAQAFIVFVLTDYNLLPVKDEFYGLRVGVFYDPFGHNWHIHTPIEEVSFKEMQKRCDAMVAAK